MRTADCGDAILALASLAIILLGVGLLGAGVLFLMSSGSPALLAGAALGGRLSIGVFGIVAVLTLLFVILSVWYVVYAIMKSHVCRAKERAERSGYTIERIKKS
jgi:membrane protein implicated in regulation of membrane protease activity